jgi:hypothetical protein
MNELVSYTQDGEMAVSLPKILSAHIFIDLQTSG